MPNQYKTGAVAAVWQVYDDNENDVDLWWWIFFSNSQATTRSQ